MADVFISYSRKDQGFVRRLHEALVAAGRDTWVDWEGIPPSARWMDEVRGAIDAADAFVFVVSPDSAASPVCREEAEHALAVGKRIVPVVWRDTPESDLPDAISAHNWLTLRESDDFDPGFARLLAALDTDLDWVHEHTRLVTRAREWEASGKERSRLLRGRDLERAEQAVAAANRNPSPTSLQTAYVLASRQAERRGARIRTAVLSGGLVVAIVLAGFALLQRNAAEQNAQAAEQQRQAADEQRQLADQNARTAEQQATLAQARELTAASGRSISTDPELSILLARAAVDLVQDQDTDRGLRAALGASRVRVRYDACPTGELRALDLSADGTRFATISLEAVVCIWDRPNRRVLARIQIPGTIGRAVAVSPDGSLVAAGTEDGAVAVWRSDGTPVARWRGQDDQVRALDFSPDGSLLLSAGLDGLATLWSTSDWHRVRSVPAIADDAMVGAGFTPDGTRILTTNADLYVRAWDVATGRELEQYVGPWRTPFAAAASSDGAYVAAGAQDETARIWDAGTGTQLEVLPHGGEVYAVSFTRDGTRLATSSADGLVRIWDARTGVLIDSLAGHDGGVNAVVFTPDDAALLSAGRDGTVREWAAQNTKVDVVYGGHFGSVIGGDVSVDGRRVLTNGSGDGTVIVHDAATGAALATLRGDAGSFSQARFSADGTKITTASTDKSASLWDAATGERIERYEGGTDLMNTAALSPDGTLVVAAGEDAIVRAWGVDGSPAWQATMGGPIGEVVFSPDGSTLYTGDVTGEVAGIDPATAAVRFRLATGGSGVVALDPSPDGAQLAVLGFDAAVRIVDLKTRSIVRELPAVAGYGWDVRYSPDGTRLATGGDDGVVHVYDASTGERLADLKVDTRDAFVGQFVDAHRIFVTTRTSQAMLIDCDLCGSTQEVRTLADSRVTRDFTADERVALLHESATAAAAPTPEPVGSATPQPLPSAVTTVVGSSCTWIAGPCDAPAGRFTSARFAIPFSFQPPAVDLLLGESSAAIGFLLPEGDQLTVADGRSFTGSDGRTLSPVGDRSEDLEAYFRSRAWMKVSTARTFTVDGRRARIVQITSDTTQELSYGAMGGQSTFWATGETLDIAFVDAPGGPILIFGDRVSNTPQSVYDARFEHAVRSMQFP